MPALVAIKEDPIMKRTIERFASLAVIATMLIVTITATASAAKNEGKQFLLNGRVIEIDREAHTLLVEDRWSEKLYLVYMPEGATVRLTIGFSARISAPEFNDLRKNDYILARVKRTETEHLTRLKDGREVVVLSVVK
jgi:molybdopterin converting factor small subunit